MDSMKTISSESNQGAVHIQYPPQIHLFDHCRSHTNQSFERRESAGKSRRSPRPVTCDLPPHLVQALLLRLDNSNPLETTSTSLLFPWGWSSRARWETPSTSSLVLMNRRGLSTAFPLMILFMAFRTRGIKYGGRKQDIRLV